MVRDNLIKHTKNDSFIIWKHTANWIHFEALTGASARLVIPRLKGSVIFSGLPKLKSLVEGEDIDKILESYVSWKLNLNQIYIWVLKY